MHKFIEYPQTIQTVSFYSNKKDADRPGIESRTKDGLQVSLNAQFQYKLRKGSLYNLYMKYGENYKDPCILYSLDIMNDAATNFTADQFINEVSTVTNVLQEALKKVWNDQCFTDVQTL
jgi:hypothetical protein